MRVVVCKLRFFPPLVNCISSYNLLLRVFLEVDELWLQQNRQNSTPYLHPCFIAPWRESVRRFGAIFFAAQRLAENELSSMAFKENPSSMAFILLNWFHHVCPCYLEFISTVSNIVSTVIPSFINSDTLIHH